MNKNTIIVAGIGTDVGKTFIAAILTEALEADYWKPVQAGALDHTDSDTVHELVSNTHTVIHPETYRLTIPASPHYAAEKDGIKIELDNFHTPKTLRPLVIELAGGLMVPLNEHELNIDLIHKIGAPVVLVSQNYLGSINHTLLSVDICHTHGITIAGIIFNGERTPATESVILGYTNLNCLARIEKQSTINAQIVKRYADELREP
ncbi:MAG TPA: dethiobiotin synthase, partial [Candidatus Kapabacteria bacterium]|nr:dethiobiotin synthase [Candidatus Kapabacteria bacterium]